MSSMKKILITGGGGFIGHHLVRELVNDFQIVVIDDFSRGSSTRLEPFENKIELIKLDLRDYETLKSYIHDKPWMHFANGDIANSPQEFVDLIEKEYQDFQATDINWGWKTNFAYSVKQTKSENPEYKNQEGEWVNARFTSEDATYEEWYYIVDGKIQTWQQAKRLKAKRMPLKK